MAVDIFERNGYDDKDKLAELLKTGGMHQSAKGLDRHMQINDAGDHENVALSFIEYMAPVSKGYLQEALQICELTSRLMTQQVAACYKAHFSKPWA